MATVKSAQMGHSARVNKGLVKITFGPMHAANLDASGANVFVADQPYRVASAELVHTVAGTDAGAVTAVLKKCTGTDPPGSGPAVMSGSFNLKGTANTKQAATLVTTEANLELAAGDRLALHIGGVTTALEGCLVTVNLLPLGDQLLWKSKL